MPCALFGKLPARRDFLTVNLSGAVLLTWESWLQKGLASSKHRLGPAWHTHYLKAPLWRFLIGRAICGRPITGVFMPSVDGVGRAFPLSILFEAEDHTELSIPDSPDHQDWHKQAEDFLLDALDEPDTVNPVLVALAALEPPPLHPRQINPTLHNVHGCLGSETMSALLKDTMLKMTQEEFCFFWTIGGADYPARIWGSRGLPPADMFTEFLYATSFHDVSENLSET
jgi:type VI secretion system protein ImpM